MALTPPTVAELSAKMRARLKGEYGSEPTFNDNTTPTGVEAADLLATATGMVQGEIGHGILPTVFLPVAKLACIFKAAALVELTYYPEQANEENSAYSLYEAQYTSLMRSLWKGLRGRDATSKPSIGTVGLIGPNGYVRHPS